MRRDLFAELFSSPWAIKREWLTLMAQAATDPGAQHTIEERLAAAAAAKRAPAMAGAVAVVPVHGVMTQRGDIFDAIFGGGSVATGRLAATLAELGADPAVGAIVLDVDSPGGSVYGMQEVADTLYSLRGAKPTVAVSNSMAASAAYWLGSAADELVVAPGGEVGSIGVWMAHADFSKAYENAGIAVTLISAGKYKTEGNHYGPLSAEAREYMQEQVEDYYDMFVKAVAKNRKDTQIAVREGYGQGRTLIGERAVKGKLADRVATLGQVVGELQAKIGKGARRAEDDAAPAKASAAELRERDL
jgi:signal peptide peptidase SppA